jgi:exopolyphosphatase/guanosine-5'-triphosphate,3'-diphosphate pyrophosphatase
VKGRSFKIGTVRLLKGKVKPELWADMRAWVHKIVEGEKDVIAIGTGGNVNRLFKMSGLAYGELLSTARLTELHKLVKSMSLKDRMLKLRLRPDRADVIVPAGDIYMEVLKQADIKEMSVPKIGLSDGIALYLYRRHLDALKGTKV